MCRLDRYEGKHLRSIIIEVSSHWPMMPLAAVLPYRAMLEAPPRNFLRRGGFCTRTNGMYEALGKKSKLFQSGAKSSGFATTTVTVQRKFELLSLSGNLQCYSGLMHDQPIRKDPCWMLGADAGENTIWSALCSCCALCGHAMSYFRENPPISPG